jgi:hypothetical protein
MRKTKQITLLVSAILITLGFGGFLAVGRTIFGYVLAHTGGLGVMGLFGFLAGERALKKGYRYWVAFSWAFFLPILLGFMGAALLVDPDKPGIPLSCGGAGSLIVGTLVVIFYTVARKRN